MSRPLNSESVFRAVAHPSRRRMLELLSRKPLPATELARQFDDSQPTISRHLQVLRTAGLVSHRKQGASLVYEVVPGALAGMRRWLESVSPLAGPRR